MNDLEAYFRQNPGRLIHKWAHYFDVYDQYFSKYKGKEIVFVEIGIAHGGSLQMWKQYFGDKAKIYGIDINPECKKFEEKNIKVFIGSQSDRRFLESVLAQIPPMDVLIDDGGHTMRQQIITFEEMFGHVKSDGIYLCEDLHTSYWLKFGGGHKRKGTFIEYSKNFIDHLNAYHSEQGSLKVNSFTKSVKGIHYYDSMLVIEKCKERTVKDEETGKPTLTFENSKKQMPGYLYKPAYIAVYAINSILRFFRLPGIVWR